MMDYRSHLVALAGFQADLKAHVIAEPAIAALQTEQIKNVQQERGLTTLGALIDHLLQHAASDGSELSLLERASSLWQEGVALHTALGAGRSDIEMALLAPTDPGSPELFNNAVDNIRLLGLNVSTSGKLDTIEALRQDVMKLAHIAQHPRQLDLKLKDWGWGDVFLARRTDAFVRSTYRGARAPALNACAFGILSSYSANFCGSAYLEQVVGGPRRTHRFRDRVARNTVGSWFAQANPELGRLSEIADLIRFGPDPAAPVLPDAVNAFIREALGNTYNLGQTAPLPDLQTGYTRLVRHLELLDTFCMPATPAEPAPQFLVSLYADPSNPPTPLFTLQAANFPAGPGQGSGNSQPSNYSGSGSSPTSTDSAPTTGERCGSFWMGLIYAIMFLGGGFAPCIGAWVQGKHCTLWDAIWKEFGDANKPSQEQMDALASASARLTAAEFPVVAASSQMVTLVGNMFDLHSQLWEGLSKARAFLAIHGLIYPDDMLANPVYAQFLTVPAAVTLPSRKETDPVPNFYRYPPTPVENPPYGWAPYPSGANPDIFIGPPAPQATVPTASRAAVQTWLQIARGDQDAINYDLDADRGFQFPCWATIGPIDDDPVGFQALPYDEI